MVYQVFATTKVQFVTKDSTMRVYMMALIDHAKQSKLYSSSKGTVNLSCQLFTLTVQMTSQYIKITTFVKQTVVPSYKCYLNTKNNVKNE